MITNRLAMLPQLTEECRSKTEQNELEKLVDRLGDDTVPLMKKLIGYLDTDTRDQIVVWVIESMRDNLVSTVNKAMHDMLGGTASGCYRRQDHRRARRVAERDIMINRQEE